MKKLSIVLIAAACLLGACKKEDQKEKVVLGTAIEEVNSNQKAYIDNDRYVCFAANDVVKVNNEDATISADGRTGNLSVTRTSSYNAVYPKSILVNQNSAVPTTNVRVVLPSEQTYVTKTMGGVTRQVVDMPMAGYLGTETGTIQFRNLCSVLRIIIHNDKTIPLGVKRITVRASDAKLCGAGIIADITGNTVAPQIEMSSTNTAVQNEVSLQMTTPVNIASNSKDSFYIVIPAIPSTATNNKFTVEVIADSTANNIAYANRYSKTQGTGKTGYISRNKLGSAAFHLDANTPPDAPYMILSCSDLGVNERVMIAPGNLQYQASTTNWRFAPHSYEFIGGKQDGLTGGTTTANNTANPARQNQSDWIDMFGWGTSGKGQRTDYPNGLQHLYMPWAWNYWWGNDSKHNYYGPASGNLTGNWDWGVNNIINPRNGNATESGWYTPSQNEWACLIKSNKQYGYACIKDIYSSDGYTDVNGDKEYLSGIVLIPEGFIDPKCCSEHYNTTLVDGRKVHTQVQVGNKSFLPSNYFSSRSEGYFRQNIYTKADWDRMEAAGAVFLPAAGGRTEYSVGDASQPGHGGIVIQYWSSTRISNTEAYRFRTENGDANSTEVMHVRVDGSMRAAGLPVRLFKQVQ